MIDKEDKLVAQYDNAGRLQWRRELGEGDSTLGVLSIDTAPDESSPLCGILE